MNEVADFPVTDGARDAESKTRVLFITDAFLPHAGGARVYYHQLLRHLAARHNSEVTILTKKVPGWQQFDREESREGFHIVRCGTPLNSWKPRELPKIAFPFLRALPLIASGRFDVIHCGDLYPPGVLGLWFKRMFGIPYVGYCHGEEITLTDRFRRAPKIRNTIYAGAEIVIAANEFARQNLLRIGVPENRIVKVTPGVDFGRFSPESGDVVRARFGLHGKKVLLTVGRLVPRKGHLTVMQAMKNLKAEFPDIAFLIAGTGPQEHPLRKAAAELGLADAVHFAGLVPEADLASYYSACDLFVLPNYEDRGDLEGFGMVFLEANACGKAVVGGRSGGTAEAVLHGTTGMLVTPQAPEELASVLRLLLSDGTLRMRLGQQGLSRARTDFTWESRAAMLAHVNQTVIESARRRR